MGDDFRKDLNEVGTADRDTLLAFVRKDKSHVKSSSQDRGCPGRKLYQAPPKLQELLIKTHNYICITWSKTKIVLATSQVITVVTNKTDK